MPELRHPQADMEYLIRMDIGLGMEVRGRESQRSLGKWYSSELLIGKQS